MSHFPKPKIFVAKEIKVELDFSNYATKFVLKIAIDVSASKFFKKTDLVKLNSDIDKLNIEELQKIANG